MNSIARNLRGKKRKGLSLGIVGLQGAGKTTYLAALYDLLSSGENPLGVAAVRDPDQQDYLEQILGAIRSGDRVPKNDPSVPIEHITFEIITGHRSISISTFDYAGENTQARRQDELRDELHDVDGILLFLPPTAVRGGDEESETSKAVQKLFGDLAELKRKVHAVDVIAVVITKADMLKRSGTYDARGIELEIEQEYGKHLQQLRARTRQCKVFETSALGDEFRFTEPPTGQELKPYGIVESFHWLLDTASRLRNRRVWRKRVLLALVIIGVFLSITSAFRWHEQSLFRRVEASMVVLGDMSVSEPTKVLHAAKECAIAVDAYYSWHNLWPRRNGAIDDVAKRTKDRCVQGRQYLQRNLAAVNDNILLQDAFRESYPLLDWYPEQALIFSNWYDDIKLQVDVETLLIDLKNLQEDTVPLIEAKLGRIRWFFSQHVRGTEVNALVTEEHRLKVILTVLTIGIEFDALLEEIDRQKSPLHRYQICSKALDNASWGAQQRKELKGKCKNLRSDAAQAEWAKIQAFDRELPRNYSERISRREDFKEHFPDIAKNKKCEQGIADLASSWDRWEYEQIRAAFDENPVNGIDATARRCRDYRDSGRTRKEFLAIIKGYLQWYEGLEKKHVYTAKVSQLKIEKSGFSDKKREGRIIQVSVAVQNVRKSSLTKKTDNKGIAYDLGVVNVPWQLGDSITVEVICFNGKNESVKKTLDGRATLAYLAGKKGVVLPEGVEVRFKLTGTGTWFNFPYQTKDH